MLVLFATCGAGLMRGVFSGQAALDSLAEQPQLYQYLKPLSSRSPGVTWAGLLQLCLERVPRPATSRNKGKREAMQSVRVCHCTAQHDSAGAGLTSCSLQASFLLAIAFRAGDLPLEELIEIMAQHPPDIASYQQLISSQRSEHCSLVQISAAISSDYWVQGQHKVGASPCQHSHQILESQMIVSGPKCSCLRTALLAR